MTEADRAAIAFDRVTKVYPGGVVALAQVSVEVRAGTIHAFVGENGAGKSTLMKVLNGEVRADLGTVRLDGREVRFANARAAMASGVGMVHQEILLVSELTVWENVVLGAEPTRRGLVDREAARASVRASIDRYELGLDPDAIVGDLGVAARQKVEICKLLHRDVRVLILDEPTAVLTPQEIPPFFDELRRLRDAGRTICFISHHLDEVLALSDRVTVLRDGEVVATLDTATTNAPSLARLMVERDVVFTADRSRVHTEGPDRPGGAGGPALVLDAVCVRGADPRRVVGPLTFSVHAGEVVGVAAVEGNGQSELVDAVTGAVRVRSGRIVLAGSDATSWSVLARRRLMAFVPSERKVAGGAVLGSITDNVTMTHHRLTPSFSRLRGWLLDRGAARRFALEVQRSFDVEMASTEQVLGSLSGGNQQKVILGRELLEHRPVVVLDQPTRGLDVGSIEFVHRRVLQLRDAGVAVLLVSADLDELLRLSDRIVVLHRGRIVDDVPAERATLTGLGRAMLEGAPAA